MVRRLALRVLMVIPLLLVISILVFLITKLGPGDPIQDAFGNQLSPEAIQTIRDFYRLDDPLFVQYFAWFGSLFTDGGGSSIVLKVPVLEILLPAFGNTLILAAGAILICVVLGVAIGFFSGIRHGTISDRATMVFMQVGSNLPVYWFGLILIWFFAVQLRWLPAAGMYDLRGDKDFGDLLRHLILPALATALISMLIMARFTRSATITSKNSDYIKTFRSQGFSRRRLYGKHVGRNILPPIVNTTGLEIGTLLTGVVFVESIFSWPGIGSQLTNAVSGNDYPLIQSGILLVALCFVFVNLITDVTLDLLNPRLRHA